MEELEAVDAVPDAVLRVWVMSSYSVRSCF